MNKLKAARLAAGLTQAQLAAAVGCRQKDISRYESGEVSLPGIALSTAAALAKALNIHAEDLL